MSIATKLCFFCALIILIIFFILATNDLNKPEGRIDTEKGIIVYREPIELKVCPFCQSNEVQMIFSKNKRYECDECYAKWSDIPNEGDIVK